MTDIRKIMPWPEGKIIQHIVEGFCIWGYTRRTCQGLLEKRNEERISPESLK